MDTQPVQHSRAAEAKIKIVGVGGAGVNAVSGLKLEDLGDVGIAAINTDAQALAHSTVREKLLIGGGVTRGLGAGGEVELGRAAAEGDREAITVLLGKMDLIILVVGLGGGTGSAAASIVAEVAAKSEALVLAFATLPFSFEGARRKRIAEDGMAELRKVVHGLIPLPNDVLLQEGEEDMSVLNAFAVADRWIGLGVHSLCAILLQQGLINQDLASLRTVFQNQGGKTIFATGHAAGDDYVKAALDDLFLCPLLHIGARPAQLDRILVNVIGGEDLGIAKVNEVISQIAQRFESRTDIVFGAVIDAARGDSLEICVLGKSEMEASSRSDAPQGDAAPVLSQSSPQMAELDGQAEIVQDDGPSRAVHRSKLGKKKHRSQDQDEFTFSEVDAQRGYFEQTDRNDYNEEDLDVPTYLRRGIKIRLK